MYKQTKQKKNTYRKRRKYGKEGEAMKPFGADREHYISINDWMYIELRERRCRPAFKYIFLEAASCQKRVQNLWMHSLFAKD